jgi:hypothetical protein
MSTEVTTYQQPTTIALAGAKEIDKMDLILSDVEPSKIAGMPRMRKALTIAAAMQSLRELLKGQLMKNVMALAGTELGFKTDRDAPFDKNGKPMVKYNESQVRDAAIAALMKGAQLCGNEFNIIATRSYLTKEFFERACAEYPGLTDLKLTEGVPVTAPGGALVPYIAKWNFHGVPDCVECIKVAASDTRIPVKGTGADAILGKAKRKILARVYARVTGSLVSDFVQEDEPEEQESGEIKTMGETAPITITNLPEPEPAEQPTVAMMWRELDNKLAAADMISQVDALYKDYLTLCATDEQRTMLDGLCTETKTRIRESRGSSNG